MGNLRDTLQPALSRALYTAICALAAAGLIGCFQNKPTDVAGGGGVETTDGEIVAAAGMLQGARVRLVPEHYNPLSSDSFPDSLTATTDAAGRYAFKALPIGTYNLEAFQPKDGTRLFRSGLVLAPGASRSLPITALARTGKLRLVWEGGHHGYLFIPGTTIVHHILPEEVETPILVLDSLPMGRLPPVFWSQTKADTVGARITDSLAIQSDSTSEWNMYAAWTHHGTWHINTTASGADIAADVTAFPMLVRLTAPDFDFGQAAADGRDIRFSDADGTALSYQVERWDALAGQAEIWVRVPKVDGNSNGDSFRMYWGNAAAEDHSSGPDVFGTDNGFSAVLHLGEAGSTTTGGYTDATGSGKTGTGTALTGAATAEGAVGLGQTLDGTSQAIKVAGNFPSGNAPRCLSAWGKSAKPSASSQLVDYGSANALASYGLWNNGTGWTAWHWGSGNDITTPAKADTVWHLLTLDYDGTTSRIYLDGALIGSAAKALATTANGFTIGSNYEGNTFWPGKVDEVEMSAVSRSVFWIRLAFENQKQGSNTLQLEIAK